MRHTTTEHPAVTRPRYVKLQCPECTHAVPVPRDELAEGGTAVCRHCGTEAELVLGLDGETGRQQWLLLDPLLDFADDADERR